MNFKNTMVKIHWKRESKLESQIKGIPIITQP